MTTLNAKCTALIVYACAALLAGCAGSEPPMGPFGAMQSSLAAAGAERSVSWMLQKAKRGYALGGGPCDFHVTPPQMVLYGVYGSSVLVSYSSKCVAPDRECYGVCLNTFVVRYNDYPCVQSELYCYVWYQVLDKVYPEGLGASVYKWTLYDGTIKITRTTTIDVKKCCKK